MYWLHKFVFSRYGRSAPLSIFTRAAELTCRASSNNWYDIRWNGEQTLLKRLKTSGIMPYDPVLFDVGAHSGQWSRTALDIFPHARVWCFEMVPETANTLMSNFFGDDRVTVVPRALADSEEPMTACLPENRRLARLLRNPEPGTPAMELTPLTGDNFVREHRIEHIDMLKIDVEGWSLHVLHGFRNTLASGKIGAVQFEYNQYNIFTRTFLADIYSFLEDFGFSIGKVFPNHVRFGTWDMEIEDFRGPNFLALPENKVSQYTRRNR